MGAIFALINLVIPCTTRESAAMNTSTGTSISSDRKRQIVDELVGKIVSRTVTAMENFPEDLPLISRSCIVLSNLSIIEHYRITLLWTEGCYRMLILIRNTYAHNNMVRRSVDGTLDNLRSLLAKDKSLRERFLVFMKQGETFTD